jgi:hypothetical protein
MAYTYLASAFVGLAITRFRHRGTKTADTTSHDGASDRPSRDSVAR